MAGRLTNSNIGPKPGNWKLETHPLDETLADPHAATADHALAILRGLPRPLSGLDIQHITDWARRKRAERLVNK